MKIFTHRILIGIVCLSALFLGYIWEENHKIELPIDTPEEAIEYAKTDLFVKEWIEEWSDHEIIANAGVENQRIWYVKFEAVSHEENRPIGLNNPNYVILMSPDGTIIFGRSEPESN